MKRIRGITIEIDGNVGPLSKALEGVNKHARDLEGELRHVEKLLKLDPKNVDLLTQRKKLLADAVQTSADRLQTLKTAQEQTARAFAEGKAGEDQYRAIQREVIEATAKLKTLEDQLADVNDRFKQASDRVRGFGEGLAGAGEKMAPLSAAAGATLGGIVALSVSSAQAADNINVLAQQTGLSTEEIQKFQYASGRIDVPLEVLTGSMAKLTRNMFAASEQLKLGRDRLTGSALAFDELGVSVTNADGSLRSNQDVMADVIGALAAKTNATERDAYAMTIFGKSAQQLNPLILGGADALKVLGKEAEDLNLILSQDTIDGLAAIDEELEKTKAQLTATSAVISAEFGAIILPLLQQAAEFVQVLAARFREMDEGTAKVILVTLALVAAAAPLLMIFGQVAMGISAIIALIPTITAGFAAFRAMMLGTASSAGILTKALTALKVLKLILLGPIGLVIAAVALLAVGTVALVRNWGVVTAFFSDLWARVREIFSAAVTAVLGAVQGLSDGATTRFNSMITRIREAVSGVTEAIAAPFRQAQEIVGDITATIGGFLERLNPFARNSPSLVDNVRAGVAVIQREYAKLENLSLPTLALAGGTTSNVNHYGGHTFQIYVSGGTAGDQADGIIRELRKRGVKL